MIDMWDIILSLISFIAFIVGPIVILILLASIKVVYEFERGVKFTLGKYSGLMNPGVNLIIPILQSWRRIDLRVQTIDIPPQDVMTKDNVPASVDAVVYFRVKDPEKAVINVREYTYAISKYAQTSLRKVAGEVELDDMLSKREEIAERLRDIVDVGTDPWGLDVTTIELQDIKLPENLKRAFARQAEAEREKRAAIKRSEGENEAANDLVKASELLTSNPGALHLRTLATLNDVASDNTNTVKFFIPVEAAETYEEELKGIKKSK